ncbi:MULTISPECIES: sigma-54 interaction domain-containing protein [Edwardsiella]|nr:MULTISPECIES: sigma-54-dependent Fis family transcriptional regulator [Edwardsiella]AKM46719.1 Fis family transcriptional regulator [Edwardsiella sp. EA181011]GAJ68457.1 sigma-54 interaction domain protein [Edwardsiella piscicida]AKR78960.1 sigma-54-dependent Fis family transcriptional regulator [Edwardsiella sp. LADL05-105]KAB0588173.1 sigma-54-dependent transcriptional regulator [Edwardsiella anguillarum]RFT03442.1 sigma-54-dependent Fis family transcriptional regulator [Edwardsiella angu
MTPANTQSVLMQIQPTILRFTKMLSSVLQLEVEIVDATMTRVAGTGPYGKFFGRKLNSNSRLLRYVLDTKQEKVVIRSRFDPVCEGCNSKDNCKEKAFLGTPILFQGNCIGVISLVAFTQEQQERIKDNLHEFSDYVRHISNIFVSKLLESQGGNDGVSKILLSLIENMDQGVLVLDENNQAQFANATALKQLNAINEQVIGKTFNIRPLTYQQNYLSGHLQHIVAFDQHQELIIGQLHDIQDHQLFLMTFHQSHSPMNVELNPDDPRIEHLVGECRPMRNLKRLISRIASSPSSVLIVGESGTGKEVVARAIHQLSDRNNKPFIAINCAAIPDQLLESELFGYVKGAFTGASANGKMGLIQAANHGTLFLDEIGDMPLTLQAKLLRAIESREVQPIGSSSPIAVDIRIISATNQNLEQYIADGKFREDLYYRLNVIPMALPPLRERQGDIELLIHYFLNLHTKRIGLVYPGISPEVMMLLKRYRWPGNVRELSNLMEYLINVVPSGEVIDTALLPPNLINGQVTLNYREDNSAYQSSVACGDDHGSTALEEMEKQMIREALARYSNKKQAAEELGIGIATLYRKIKKYELTAG